MLHIAPKAARQSAGAMVWGRERTQHVLFASSEPRDADDETGYHRAFDIHTQKQLYELDAQEGGDAMAIDPQGECAAHVSHAYAHAPLSPRAGSTLALFTLGPGASHVLRLFDLRTKRARRAVHKTALEAFRFARGAPACDGEVTAAAFSPDGALLAAARNDNQLHVYDARFLARGPLLRFCHWGAERCAPGGRFGVTEAKWVQGWGGLGLGLVSGGMDGEQASTVAEARRGVRVADAVVVLFAFCCRMRPAVGRAPLGRDARERDGARAGGLRHQRVLARGRLQRREAARRVSRPPSPQQRALFC